MKQVGHDLHTVIDLQLKLMILRKQFTDILSDILQCEITHQIFFFQQFLYGDAFFVFFIFNIRYQNQRILLVQFTMHGIFAQRQIGKYHIQHIILDLFQQMIGQTDGDLQIISRMIFPVFQKQIGQMSFVDGICAADAEIAVILLYGR